jgi:hypothetical protein
LYAVHCGRKRIIVETVFNPAELMQLRDLPDGRGEWIRTTDLLVPKSEDDENQ